MKDQTEILDKYLPDNTKEIIAEWITTYGIYLRITRSRSTKLGDYYPPITHNYHKITVNHDLNKYAFLITLVHEVAHLKVWLKYKNKVKPHGLEWKYEFRILMDPIIALKVFPEDIEIIFLRYLTNAKASTSSDLDLSRILRKYDEGETKILLENIPDQTVFSLSNGKTFKKGEKLRKRYRCICLNNKRIYLINPLVEVIPLK